MEDADLIGAALATITITRTKAARDLVAGDVLVLAAPAGSWAAARTVVTHVEATKHGLIRTTEHGIARLRNPQALVTVEEVRS